MQRSTSSIQPAFLGVNTEWASSRREPEILLMAVRPAAIWSLLRKSHVGSSNGAPQWQIEAMRRLEIPEEMRKQHKFAALGAADGRVKAAIFGGNASKLYHFNPKTALGAITNDKIAAIRAEYVAAGGERSNARYGYVARPTV